MNAIFAKFIFSVATVLLPGDNLPFPPMRPAADATGLTAVALGVPPSNGPADGRPVQGFCSDTGGVYQVGFHLGMEPLHPKAHEVVGWVETSTHDGPVILARWYAAPGEWTIVNNTVALRLGVGECFQLTYRATGAATINADPRVTYLTITR